VDARPVAALPGPGVASYADAVEPLQRAVVSVYSTRLVRSRSQVQTGMRQAYAEKGEQDVRQQGLGSGVLLSADGYIVTNNHVVDGADELRVLLADDRELTGRLVGTDSKTDLAVVKIDAVGLPFATLGDSDRLRVGDLCFALGNPLGVGQTVTMGIVSAVGRSNLELLDEGRGYESFIQTDAAINMGNSGGALIDARGRLIGINTAILSPSKGSVGIGFAIPVNLVSAVVRSLVENNGVVQRGMLGIEADTLSAYPEMAETLGLRKDQKGVLVQQLRPEGPAARAGLQREDVVVAVNDHAVGTLQDLRFAVSQMPPGSVARLRLIRAGNECSVEVTLGTLEANADNDELLPGVLVSVLTDELRRRYELDRDLVGVVIEQVDEHSALRSRLSPGMVILEVNRVPVSTLQQVRSALKKSSNNLLYLHFRGAYRYLPLPAK
jgi:serine protease Do/serine protease DegQ